MTAAIETVNLTKYYGKARGVVDLDLCVTEGDIFGFIGPNGAGKSTTIRILLGYIFANSGKAQIFGLDCRKQRAQILANIGYMSGEACFYQRMRVEEIIRLSAKLHRCDCRKEAQELCERLHLDPQKRVEELSLGNRKKLSIVCAFQHNPRLFILDEPTSGLDPLIQKEFFTLVQERHSQGATVFLSSHVLSEIQRHCTKAAIIREGHLVVSDSVDNLSKTAARRVTLHGICSPPFLTNMADLHIQEKERQISFLYQGEIPDLISGLQGLPITDMTITEPDIEEIFLHFYAGGEKQ